MFPSQFANIILTYPTFVTDLNVLRVELRCKLQEKLPRVTMPSVATCVIRASTSNLHCAGLTGGGIEQKTMNL